MCGEKLCVCACQCVEDRERETERGRLSPSSSGKCMQEQHEELLSAACQALTRALTPALPPSLCPSPAGLPTSLLLARRPGEMSNSHSGTGMLHRLTLWNGCSLWQINALSFPCALPLSDSQEEKRRGKMSMGRETAEVVLHMRLHMHESV